MFYIKAVDKIRTHILCSATLFSENRAIYEIMCKILFEPETTVGNIMWRMSFACWISKGKNTHSQNTYVILSDSSRQQWFHERPSVLSYHYTASFVNHNITRIYHWSALNVFYFSVVENTVHLLSDCCKLTLIRHKIFGFAYKNCVCVWSLSLQIKEIIYEYFTYFVENIWCVVYFSHNRKKNTRIFVTPPPHLL